MRESKVLSGASDRLLLVVGVLILLVCAVDYYSPETIGSEGLHGLRRQLTIAGVVMVVAALVFARQKARLSSAPAPPLKPEALEGLSFLEPSEHGHVHELKYVYCSEVKDPEKAFGFITTNAIMGRLYVTPKRLAYVKGRISEPALNVSLEQVRGLEYRGSGKHRLLVDFCDDEGRESTWHFHVRHYRGLETHYEYEVWRQRAEECLGRARIRDRRSGS